MIDSSTLSDDDLDRCDILGAGVDVLSIENASKLVIGWASERMAKVVCLANVHMIMEGWDRDDFKEVLRKADLVLADGMPLVWVQRISGYRRACQVRGTDLMLELCARAEVHEVPIALLGGPINEESTLIGALQRRFPKLVIATALAPPFRALSPDENVDICRRIRDSGAGLVFVGLGCPKQEIWMSDNRDNLPMPLIGVGAAFDFITGRKKMAPAWMSRYGMEWFFRLASEPRRLWRRYMRHNPRFLGLMLRQLLGISRNRR